MPVKHYECLSCHRAVHLKMVKVVIFILFIFTHGKNRRVRGKKTILLSLSEELRFEQGLMERKRSRKNAWEGGNSHVCEEEQGSYSA